eukprot:4239507-Pleurochrysis_carterae.AAC.1
MAHEDGGRRNNGRTNLEADAGSLTLFLCEASCLSLALPSSVRHFPFLLTFVHGILISAPSLCR